MSINNQELEVKFYITDLEALERRIIEQGARLVQPRTHEVNLQFDTQDGELKRNYKVLRLRKNNAARLTFKGPGEEQDGARLRRELEFVVSDFSTAKELFEALGYIVDVMYEKYRTVFNLEKVLVTLDEMPYGRFAEIEGPDGYSIRAAAELLELDWQARILDSYLALFDRARSALGFEFQHLSFENFEAIEVPPSSLDVQAADIS
jgi:predicted adenylyl cyclase CyaB